MKVLYCEYAKINGQPFDEGKVFSMNDPRHSTQLTVRIEHAGEVFELTAKNPTKRTISMGGIEMDADMAERVDGLAIHPSLKQDY